MLLVQELYTDPQNEHIATATLGLLARLPINLPALRSSGLITVVKSTGRAHSSRPVRELSSKLFQSWQELAAAGKPAGSSGTAVTGPMSRSGSHSNVAAPRTVTQVRYSGADIINDN